jgi:hypothetical protein
VPARRRVLLPLRSPPLSALELSTAVSSSAVVGAQAAGVAVGPPCSTAIARVAAELTSLVSAAPRHAASSSAVGRLVPPPRDVVPSFPCGHLGSALGLPRTVGHEPAAHTGYARHDSGPRGLHKPGRANLVQTGRVGTVAVGCALLCRWAVADSARWPLNYFSIF